MELEEILQLLDSSTIEAMNIVNNPSFSSTHMIGGASTNAMASRDVLCFVRASVLNVVAESSRTASAFFVLLDEPLKPFQRDVSVVSFTDYAEWIGCYEFVSSEFRDLRRRKDELLALTPMVAASTPLDKLLNMFEEILDAPCSVLDNSLSIIAKSKAHSVITGFGSEESKGLLPDDAIHWMRAHGLVNPEKFVEIGGFPYKDPADGKTDIFNHFAPIINHGVRIATVSFFTRSRPMRKSREQLIPLISQMIAISFQQDQTFLLNKSTFYANLFAELEQGTFEGDFALAAKRFSIFGYTLLPFLHVAVVDLRRENVSPYQIGNLAKKLHPAFKNSVYAIKETEIIFLTSSNSATSIDTVDFPLLTSAIGSSHTIVGISNLFTNPQRTAGAVKEARRALAIGDRLYPDKHVYAFHKLRIDDMLLNVADQHLLYSYRYPPLMEIIRQDKENGTNLAYTLYAFIQNPENPKEVAERLSIHKNTLYFRLNKIKEIIGHDFRDAETTAILQITFHVLKVQDRFKELILGKDGIDFLEENIVEQGGANGD